MTARSGLVVHEVSESTILRLFTSCGLWYWRTPRFKRDYEHKMLAYPRPVAIASKELANCKMCSSSTERTRK
jgi:hypothetical protein